jgi:hypothetical protein
MPHDFEAPKRRIPIRTHRPIGRSREFTIILVVIVVIVVLAYGAGLIWAPI